MDISCIFDLMNYLVAPPDEVTTTELTLSVPVELADKFLAAPFPHGTVRRNPHSVYYTKHTEDIADNRWMRVFKGTEPPPRTKRYLSTCTMCWAHHIAIFPVDEEPEEIDYKCKDCGRMTRRTFAPYLPAENPGVIRAQEAGAEWVNIYGDMHTPPSLP